jgi:hypothetical protein
MDMQLFTRLFQALSDKQKSDYLLNLLEEKPKRRFAFVKHFESLYEQIRLENEVVFSFNERIHSIIKKAEEVSETLGELNFEETDWERWQGSDHYMPDYEVAQIVAEDEASEAFENYASELGVVWQTGDLTDIISDFTAVFHGITCAEIADPYCNLGDPANEYFIGEIENIILLNQNKRTIREFTDSDFQHAIELAFRFNDLKYRDENEYLKFISGVLIIIINNKKQAEYVWASKEKFNVRLNNVPKLLNKVTRLIGDKKIWIESLESCFLQDYDSSIELMEYYHANDNAKFENGAINLWNKFHARSLDYLLNKVLKGTPFHLTLLKNNAIQRGEVVSLEVLKQYISSDEIEKFIDAMDNNNTKAMFYAHEKCFDKLTELINANCFKNQNVYYTIDFEKAVVYLFAERPKVAWKMIKNMITIYIEKYRSRNTYAYIAKLLVMAQRIEGIDSEIKTLTTNLYNHKPNLSALKDEFKKAGLV